MKTEIQEVLIKVKNPRSKLGHFEATVRDGVLVSLDPMFEGEPFHIPEVEEMRAYIQFLQEVIEAKKQD